MAAVVLAGDARSGLVVLATDGGGVVVVEDDDGQSAVTWLVRCTVAGVSATAAAVAPGAVVVSFDDKSTVVWAKTGSEWVEQSKISLQKRASAVRFAPGSVTTFLLADKFGDIFVYDSSRSHETHPVQNGEAEDTDKQEPLLGHCGMVTDLAVSEGLIASGDREGKIRISRYPHSYVIESFCFGHSNFVSRLLYTKVGQTPVLVSGSGDGSVRLWGARDGVQKQTKVIGTTEDGTVCTLCAGTPRGDVSLVVAGIHGVGHPLHVFTVNAGGESQDLTALAFADSELVTGAAFQSSHVLVVSTTDSTSKQNRIYGFSYDTATNQMQPTALDWDIRLLEKIGTDKSESPSAVIIPGNWLSGLGKGEYEDNWKGKKRPKCERSDWVEPNSEGREKKAS